MVRNQQITPLIAGVILMGLGGLFLIAQLLGGNFWAYFWPYPIIAAGVTFLIAMVSRGRGAGGLAIPGSIITTVGLILFLQNSFGWWESWAFAWTFIVISVGVGIFIMGVVNQSDKSKRNGLRIAAIGVLLLVPFGIFFGLGFSFLGFTFATRVIWPLILLGVGAVLVLRGVLTHSLRAPSPAPEAPTAEAHPTEMQTEMREEATHHATT
jgi:hypothetical protein